MFVSALSGRNHFAINYERVLEGFLLRLDETNYALLQSDVHSGSCAGPDEVSYQLREASFPFP
jgi:hypothetical protein